MSHNLQFPKVCCWSIDKYTYAQNRYFQWTPNRVKQKLKTFNTAESVEHIFMSVNEEWRALCALLFANRQLFKAYLICDKVPRLFLWVNESPIDNGCSTRTSPRFVVCWISYSDRPRTGDGVRNCERSTIRFQSIPQIKTAFSATTCFVFCIPVDSNVTMDWVFLLLRLDMQRTGELAVFLKEQHSTMTAHTQTLRYCYPNGHDRTKQEELICYSWFLVLRWYWSRKIQPIGLQDRW